MKRKVATFVVSVIVIIFLPITLFALMASVNEYQDQGISGAVDCNGPYTVMLFIVPALIIYAAGAVFYAMLLKAVGRSLLAAVLLILCLVIVIAAGRKAWSAYREKIRPEHQETCGEGW